MTSLYGQVRVQRVVRYRRGHKIDVPSRPDYSVSTQILGIHTLEHAASDAPSLTCGQPNPAMSLPAYQCWTTPKCKSNRLKIRQHHSSTLHRLENASSTVLVSGAARSTQDSTSSLFDLHKFPTSIDVRLAQVSDIHRCSTCTSFPHPSMLDSHKFPTSLGSTAGCSSAAVNY